MGVRSSVIKKNVAMTESAPTPQMSLIAAAPLGSLDPPVLLTLTNVWTTPVSMESVLMVSGTIPAHVTKDGQDGSVMRTRMSARTLHVRTEACAVRPLHLEIIIAIVRPNTRGRTVKSSVSELVTRPRVRMVDLVLIRSSRDLLISTDVTVPKVTQAATVKIK